MKKLILTFLLCESLLLSQTILSSGGDITVNPSLTTALQTSSLAQASSSNYTLDATGATDVTTTLQTMLNQTGAMIESNPFLANATVTTAGGGIIHLKRGLYKVTALYYFVRA